ncbi:MAG TPA: RMD1 family protein [Flavisolibacter sp.]
MTHQVLSYQVADTIDIRGFKSSFQLPLLYSDESELFYEVSEHHYVCVFKYGVVSFLDHDATTIKTFLEQVTPFCRNRFEQPLEEVYQVDTGAPETRISFQKVEITAWDVNAIRLIMLNVSQSVSLDYFSELTNQLLDETNYHTRKLVDRGRLAIPGRHLKKYIGRSLLLKNRIAQNLYIFDSPEETWENEYLDKLDTELKRTFDLQPRLRNIHESIGIAKDNLDLFMALLQHRNSSLLEWVIIILILVEVINLFVEKLF